MSTCAAIGAVAVLVVEQSVCRTSLAEQLCQKCLKDGRGQVVVLAQSAVTLLIDQVQVTRIHAWHMAC